MSRRRASGILLALGASLFLLAPRAHAQEPRRVAIVWLDGTSVTDWRQPGLANLATFLDEAALAVLSTRTTGDASDPRALRDAVATALKRHNVALIDLGDTASRAQAALAPDPRAAAAARARALRGADETLGDLHRSLDPEDLIVVVSSAPSAERQKHRVLLGAVGIRGDGIEPGLLSSGTTRRAGVLALADLVPTLLDLLDLPIPDEMDGRPARVHPNPDAPAILAALDRDLADASSSRRLLTREMLLFGMVAVALASTIAIAGERSKLRVAPGADAESQPRFLSAERLRPTVAVLLLAAAAFPLFLYLEGLLAIREDASEAILLAIASLAAAVLARAALGTERALVAVLVAGAAVPLVDLLLGSPIGHRSPLAFQIAGGGRFYGVDEGVMGMVVGAELFAAAAVLDRARDHRRAIATVATGFAVTVWLLGSPAFGSKFGAALTAVPAFGVLAACAGGRRLTLKAIGAIAAVTVLTTGSLVLADSLRDPESRSHVARAAEGRTDLGNLLERKLEANWEITTQTFWTPALLVFAAALLLAARKRDGRMAAVLARRPNHRAALTAVIVGSVAALAFNDGGVVAAAPMTLYAATTTFGVVLDPDRR